MVTVALQPSAAGHSVPLPSAETKSTVSARSGGLPSRMLRVSSSSTAVSSTMVAGTVDLATRVSPSTVQPAGRM